jgi:hypothetical protein
LMNLAAENPELQRRVTAFVQRLQKLAGRTAEMCGSRPGRYPSVRHACFGRVAAGSRSIPIVFPTI